MKNLLALLLTILLPALHTAPADRSIVLTHVTVIDLTGASPKSDQTIIITGNRIALLGKDGEVVVPPDSHVIDATGKFLIPGLWDMHAHTVYDRADDTEKTFLPLFVANGITGIRNMGSINSLEQINKWRNSAPDKLTAPRIIIGQHVDGFGGINVSFVYRVKGTSDARAAVRRIKREGFDFVKVYGRLSRDDYFAVADEAKQLNISFAGHVPTSVNNGEASDAGQKSIEHLEGMLFSVSSDESRIRREWLDYEAKTIALKGKPAPPELEVQQFRLITEGMDTYNAEKAASLYKKFVLNETYLCPTLVIHRAWGSLSNPAFFDDPLLLRYVPKRQRQSVNLYLDAARSWSMERKAIAERLYKYRLRMVGEMNSAGVKLLAGTDTAYGYPAAGFALHDELALFVQAGLSPLEALQTATINPAKFFGRETELGTIEKGKLADLILLDANPLTDISNTKKINAVIANGRLLDRNALDKVLSEIEAVANKK